MLSVRCAFSGTADVPVSWGDTLGGGGTFWFLPRGLLLGCRWQGPQQLSARGSFGLGLGASHREGRTGFGVMGDRCEADASGWVAAGS